MALRRRPNYEDQEVRISILAGARPRDRMRWCRLISHIPTPPADGGAIRSTTTKGANLTLVKSAPEVRVLPSAGVTRPQRYHDPVRPPPRAATIATLRTNPYPFGSLPITRITLPACPAQLPRRIGTGARVGCFPVTSGLPRISGGSTFRDVIFEACPGFTRVTARRIAQPPRATFVASLQLGRLPHQAACRLPDQTDYYLDGTYLHW